MSMNVCRRASVAAGFGTKSKVERKDGYRSTIQMPLFCVKLGFLLMIVLFGGSDVKATTTRYSLDPRYDEAQPLSTVHLHRQMTAINSEVSITATPDLLGSNGNTVEWVTVSFTKSSGASGDDWIALFSPAKFDGRECLHDLNSTYEKDIAPFICNSPIKFQYANFSNPNYEKGGSGSLKFLIINQRYDYAFGFFSGGLASPVLEGISNTIQFKDPNTPVWPRLALGKEWNEMTLTWTSGYSDKAARPLVVWKWEEDQHWKLSLAVTITYKRSDVCGPPAATIGWRDPGYTHTVFLKNLWATSTYIYKVGHKLKDGTFVWGQENSFKTAPYPGQDSLQRVIIFGDMGKSEKDGNTEYHDTQKGALNVTDALVNDIENIDLVIHNGDITYADGYLSQWDQFAEQISNITNRVPYLVSAGNHERDWPNSGSYYVPVDSGGECGVPLSTTFSMPTRNKDKFWYSADWGKFHFCVANSEMDWRKGSEQYKFLEECLGAVDRKRQPWLIFIGHRVLGYSSAEYYQTLGTFAEPTARDNLQDLWQKYKVDIATYGHVHNYERTCPVYQDNCVGDETTNYSGQFNGTIHIVAGTGGRTTEGYGIVNTTWSLVKDYSLEHGYLKFTSADSESLLVEFIHASDGSVFDTFNFKRKYTDVLGCDASLAPICPPNTSADL